MTATIETSPVHGTAVAVHGRGFLFLGAAGSGKSALALKMMAFGAQLIADDGVLLRVDGGQVKMSPPDAIKGLIEARSVGILQSDWMGDAVLDHVIDLDAPETKRLPHLQKIDVLGVRIDLINGQNQQNLAASLIVLAVGGRAC